ncbi:MAG: hypothetical protein JW940_34205 [Polyangiaceae bacterium]|nr:hypothetical protein [Polyangiaceae bacterium]
MVTDETLARHFPELAVLSVMAHGHADVVTALAVAEIAAAVALGLESDKQALYLDLIETALGDAARKAFQMLPQNYQFQGPSYRLGKTEGRAEGRTEGRAEGKADSVLVVLEARGIVVTDEQHRQILECDDLERLGVWLRKAATVADASELFES